MDHRGNTGSATQNSTAAHSKRRNLLELAIAYGLILIVIWTPRPWQRLLWWVAVAAVVVITSISFDGLNAMGLRAANFFRSLWVVGAALLVAALAVILAASLHTLRLPGSTVSFIKTYWAYSLWAAVQQFLLQCFFLSRLLRLLPNVKFAAAAAAALFALAHLPSPILAPITLIWGFAACLIFLRYRNLYPVAMAHAIFGVTIAITVPGHVDHNMRVGRGYLNYRDTHKLPKVPQSPPL
jgi:membrane protease YdiL (CAAX protease family)